MWGSGFKTTFYAIWYPRLSFHTSNRFLSYMHIVDSNVDEGVIHFYKCGKLCPLGIFYRQVARVNSYIYMSCGSSESNQLALTDVFRVRGERPNFHPLVLHHPFRRRYFVHHLSIYQVQLLWLIFSHIFHKP